QVVQEFWRFLELFPQDWEVFQKYSSTSSDQKYKYQWIQAKETLLKLIEHTSSPPRELLAKIYSHCGYGYLTFKEYQQAFTLFERALQIHSHTPRAYEGLSDAYYLLK